jgi:hypothetical protein
VPGGTKLLSAKVTKCQGGTKLLSAKGTKCKRYQVQKILSAKVTRCKGYEVQKLTVLKLPRAGVISPSARVIKLLSALQLLDDALKPKAYEGLLHLKSQAFLLPLADAYSAQLTNGEG